MHVDRKINNCRVLLTEKMVDSFFQIFEGTVSEFARNKALPYLLVYNLAHGRIKSISQKHYRRIFGVDPPQQALQRVDGEYFRGMVRLWTFLNAGATKKNLLRELHPGKKPGKTDYRIFTGEIKTVPIGLERRIEQRFFDQGLNRSEIRSWIEELERSDHEARVSYEAVKPSLLYLKQVLHVGVNRLLNQSVSRYESGQLKTVSKARYDHVLHLKKKAESVLQAGSRSEIENLRKEITGQNDRLTSFAQIEDQLGFLETHGVKGSKRYLGRSISNYNKGRLFRIAVWRAEKIRRACEALIGRRPDILLTSLPEALLKQRVSALLSTLKLCLIVKLIKEDSGEYERIVLEPTFFKKGKPNSQRYTAMDNAPSALRMSRKAFDLMVATHSDLFREIAIYNGKWCVPERYFKNLTEKGEFLIVKNKYELLAKGHVYGIRARRSEAGMMNHQEMTEGNLD